MTASTLEFARGSSSSPRPRAGCLTPGSDLLGCGTRSTSTTSSRRHGCLHSLAAGEGLRVGQSGRPRTSLETGEHGWSEAGEVGRRAGPTQLQYVTPNSRDGWWRSGQLRAGRDVSGLARSAKGAHPQSPAARHTSTGTACPASIGSSASRRRSSELPRGRRLIPCEIARQPARSCTPLAGIEPAPLAGARSDGGGRRWEARPRGSLLPWRRVSALRRPHLLTRRSVCVMSGVLTLWTCYTKESSDFLHTVRILWTCNFATLPPGERNRSSR